jgi:hypothetical protein
MHVPPEEPESMIITTKEDKLFANPDLLTPMRRPFPVAKPLVSHMIHAYSPVKPSPLSRILMLSNSPNTPLEEMTTIPEGGLGSLEEMGRYDDDDDEGMMITETPEPLQMSLAAELGVESPPDVMDEDVGMSVHHPLKRKRAAGDGGGDGGRKKISSSSSVKSAVAAGKKKITHMPGNKEKPDTKMSSGKALGGGRRTLRSGGSSGIEKENGKKKNPVGTAIGSSNVKKTTSTGKSTTKSSVGGRTTMITKGAPPPKAGGVPGLGPRRVPLDSEDAPQIPRRKS